MPHKEYNKLINW